MSAIDARDVGYARQCAENALEEYAVQLLWWNAPDNEHTRLTLRNMVEDVITAIVPASAPSSA